MATLDIIDLEESELRALLDQPAALTTAAMNAIERRVTADEDGQNRRIGFSVLTRPMTELIASVDSDRDAALSLAMAAHWIGEYRRHLEELVEMMLCAEKRIGHALCVREDLDDVLREARLH